MTPRFPDEADRRKRAMLNELLEEGLVMVHLDARPEEVDVPTYLKEEPALPLNLSHRFGLDVFEIGPLAVKASLSFKGVRHLCVLPWHAIFAMRSVSSGRQALYPDALPDEVKAALSRARAEAEAAGALDEASEGLESESPAPEALEAAAHEPEETPPPGRPTLKLVK